MDLLERAILSLQPP